MAAVLCVAGGIFQFRKAEGEPRRSAACSRRRRPRRAQVTAAWSVSVSAGRVSACKEGLQQPFAHAPRPFPFQGSIRRVCENGVAEVISYLQEFSRMAISKRTRFEIFKRDGFTCQYCGRKTPAVVLEVDHIIPRAEGGGDEHENLVTACFDCNRGKAAGLLDVRIRDRDMSEQALAIREREEQLRAYNEAKAAERKARSAEFDEVWDYWFDLWGATDLPRWHVPWENALRSALVKIGAEEVKEAMDITAGKFRYLKADAVRYLGGVLKRKVAEAEGRVVPCTICGESIVLDHDQDASLAWHHNGCAEARANG